MFYRFTTLISLSLLVATSTPALATANNPGQETENQGWSTWHVVTPIACGITGFAAYFLYFRDRGVAPHAMALGILLNQAKLLPANQAAPHNIPPVQPLLPGEASIVAPDVELLTLRAQISPRTLERLRILVGEDNLVAAKVTRRTLESLGAQVTVVGNTDEVEHEWPNYDLVLLDNQMPVHANDDAPEDGAGLRAASRIRRNSMETPILMHSGDELTQEDLELCGADGQIVKGKCKKPDYVEAISKLVEKKKHLL